MKKTNKLISILLVLAMLLSMAPLTVLSAENLTDTTTSVTLKDADGNGLYEIGTATELYAFANLVNAGNTSVSVELTADITLNENVLKEDGTLNGDGTNFTPWVPIGGSGNNFAGVFDGKKHTISGLYYNGTDTYVGLFGGVDGKYQSDTIGVIKNIAIVDSYLKTTISGNNVWVRVGGIAGFASSYSLFQDCFAKATLEVDNSKGCKLCIGGIAGMTYANAVNCCTDVVINYNDDTMAKSIGGILASVTNGSFVNCHTNYSTLGEYNTGTEVTGCSINVTDEQFASGKITYLLNGSKAESGSVWKQTLGEDNYPSFNGKYVDYDESRGYYNLAHTHSFEYSDDGDTITATCTAKDCYLNNADGGTLKISAPADLYVDGITAKEATVENNLVDTSVAISDITYSAPYGLPPKDAGTYTASVTVGGATASVQFELVKRSAAADNFIYTVPENLVYDGTAKYATVEVSPEITGMGEITVAYYKDGEAVDPINAGTYTVKVSTAESNKYYAINDVELASFTINAKDISDGFIILGDALTYNGKEQTQTVEKVLPTGTAPEATYTVSGNKATNVGVYLLTVTGTGNFTGEAKIAYEIAVDMNGVDFDRLHPLNVKATDREKIEYIYNQLDNAFRDYADEAKRNEWDNLKSTCVELLKMIESVENQIESFENELAKYDINTVTSDDAADLESFQNSVGKFYNDYYDNLTDEQIKKVTDIYSAIEDLENGISDVAEEITRITDAVNGYDKETVTSADVPELGKLIDDIKALTDGDNLTEDEKTTLEEADKAIDELVEKLAEVAEEIKKVDEAVKSYDEETVKSTDSEDLTQLKEDIQALIDSDNTAENEKTALEEMIEKVEALEDKIEETEQQFEEIKDIENNFNPENVSSDDKTAIEDKMAEIEAVNPDNLTDEQKAEYEEIKAGFEALLEEIAAAEKDVADIAVELEMFDENRVTKFWEDDIEALKAKIDELLADENMGEAEKAKLNEYKAQAEKLTEIINTPKEYFSLRFFCLIWDCLTWKYNGILWLFSKIFGC